MIFIIFYYLSHNTYYFSYFISSWRRYYLECIKIIMDQASLGLRLAYNESPPLESVPDAMKSLLLLRGPEDEAP
ncbi:unnamed protein product [Spirodela intermedia]|uniref:Uncharacterized protein n=1 Tax=Spirodela intermedia TaxID=51605 RepID=A0A7I8J7C1_SPIIN|nr:unnamed protein product [Spirodela intermedia]CAA6665312.1 unnamed protein product [Spirodela intermedia]